MSALGDGCQENRFSVRGVVFPCHQPGNEDEDDEVGLVDEDGADEQQRLGVVADEGHVGGHEGDPQDERGDDAHGDEAALPEVLGQSLRLEGEQGAHDEEKEVEDEKGQEVGFLELA